MQKNKKALALEKKHKKYSGQSKKSKPQKKSTKNTMVPLKAFATIPACCTD